MRRTRQFTKTLREAPADEVARNAQLLIRAGFIHKEMAGVYAYLPLGLRVIEKIKQIVREEMNATGSEELLMTTLQPSDIWEKTNDGTMRLWTTGSRQNCSTEPNWVSALRTKSQSSMQR